MHPNARLIITLVHGTWGRGFQPDSSPSAKPRWFEAGSQFRSSLEADLVKRQVDYEIVALLWSGSNSIHEREKAAQQLRSELERQAEDQPGACRLIVGHSHGGNVARRALNSLGAPNDNTLLITLATPFLDFFRPTFAFNQTMVGVSQLMILLTVFGIIGTILKAYPELLSLNPWVNGFSFRTVLGLAILFALWLALFGVKEFVERMYQNLGLVREENTKSLEQEVFARPTAEQQMVCPTLVVRGVDDEARLGLALGALGVRSSRLFLLLSARLWLYTFVALLLSGLLVVLLRIDFVRNYGWYLAVAIGIIPSMTLFLLLLSILCKSGFGREFLTSRMAWNIAANSAPDATRNLSVVTLAEPATQRMRLRHYIYDNPDCCPTIMRWLDAMRT